MTLREYIKLETSGWRWYELVYLAVCTLAILIPSLISGDSAMAVVSATCGAISVVLTGKGKLGTYIFGGIQCALYAIISYKATYYGETVLNVLYLLPLEVVGFRTWMKNMNAERAEVVKLQMTWKQRAVWGAALAAGTVALGLILKHIDVIAGTILGISDVPVDAMPFMDAFTTVGTMIAFVLTVKRYSENWWIWIAINVATVIMWLGNVIEGGENASIATLLMWSVYLVNSVIMMIRWMRESSKPE
ncbi:MAG: nicotinamide mononucleotide transporter [Bacteroidales bacterium]|nr:nicotinamide mononucleotide transporter [Bacteroidales bacterium]